MDKAISRNKVPIRLTEERWQHISTGHPEIAEYYYEILEAIENPFCIYEGKMNALIAVSEKQELGKFIVVVYKEESSEDGFIITAFISEKQQQFEKKKVLWKKQS